MIRKNQLPHYILILGLFVVLTNCSDVEKFEQKENNYHYRIKVGETFEIMFKENPSTGIDICWLNENKVKTISLIKKEWIQEGPKDCIGCGGTTIFTFKGIAVGTDSIKMTSCPTGPMRKKCSDFTEDSVGIENLILVTVN